MLALLKKTAIILIGLLIAVEAILHVAAWAVEKNYRTELPLLSKSKIRILCVGDSNTYGLYLPGDQSWPSQLQIILDKKRPDTYQVINLGYPGTPSHRIIENMPSWIETLAPDQVFLMVGANDLLYGPVTVLPEEQTLLVRAHRFISTHLRLYRLWVILKRNLVPPPKIDNDIDSIMDKLSALHSIPDSRLPDAVVDLYNTIFSSQKIHAARENGDYWLFHGDKKTLISPLFQELKNAAPYDQVRILHRPIIDLGIDPRSLASSGRLRINNTAYNLDPAKNKHAIDMEADEVIAKNIQALNLMLKKYDINLALVTYGSSNFFYGRANSIMRQSASRWGIPLIDAGQSLSTQCRTKACSEFFFEDQHPNAEGYERIAGIIAKRMLTQPGATPSSEP